jgi:hypothetical protein
MREQGMLDPARLVFIDETAVSTNLVRLNGRAPRGERVIGSIPLGKWETITFVAALRHDKMTAPMVVEGAMTVETLRQMVRSLAAERTALADAQAAAEVAFGFHVADHGLDGGAAS